MVFLGRVRLTASWDLRLRDMSLITARVGF